MKLYLSTILLLVAIEHSLGALTFLRTVRKAFNTALIGIGLSVSHPVIVDASSTSQLATYLERNIYIPSLHHHFILKQGFGSNKGVRPATVGDRTGTYTWPGGIELADNLDKILDVKGKSVLELGTGTGIVGLATTYRKPKLIAMTDGANEVLKLAELNLKSNLANLKEIQDSTPSEKRASENMNDDRKRVNIRRFKDIGHGVQIALGQLEWGNREQINDWMNLENVKQGYDVILASEVAYKHDSIPALIDTLTLMLQPNGVAVLRATPEITDDSKGYDDFVKLLRARTELDERSGGWKDASMQAPTKQQWQVQLIPPNEGEDGGEEQSAIIIVRRG